MYNLRILIICILMNRGEDLVRIPTFDGTTKIAFCQGKNRLSQSIMVDDCGYVKVRISRYLSVLSIQQYVHHLLV